MSEPRRENPLEVQIKKLEKDLIIKQQELQDKEQKLRELADEFQRFKDALPVNAVHEEKNKPIEEPQLVKTGKNSFRLVD